MMTKTKREGWIGAILQLSPDNCCSYTRRQQPACPHQLSLKTFTIIISRTIFWMTFIEVELLKLSCKTCENKLAKMKSPPNNKVWAKFKLITLS